MARRKSLESIMIENYEDLPQAIKQLKANYGENTQIEIVELMFGFWSVEIWSL